MHGVGTAASLKLVKEDEYSVEQAKSCSLACSYCRGVCHNMEEEIDEER